MATKIIMPKQGLQMTEGTIIGWQKKVGDKIEVDQPLFEMETDKLTIEICASVSGTLLSIVRETGEVVPITETIAIIGEPGEDISAILAEVTENKLVGAKARVEGEKVLITPRAKNMALDKNIDFTKVNGTGPDGLIIESDVRTYMDAVQLGHKAVQKATPVAVKIAEQNDIKLHEVNGTGARGKIIKSDIEAAIGERKNKAAAGTRVGRIIPFAGMRKVISDNMMKSLHGMAQANHRMKVDMSEVVRFREKLKVDGIKVSFTDIIVKVVSKALLDFPIVNSTLTDEGIVLKDYVNMGIAVAVKGGLIVPNIKDTDMMTIQEISAVSTDLVEKAISGNLKPDDYEGGTFTITNLGMFDIDEFTAVVNPPESAILAIGKIDRVPVVEGDNISIKPVMVLSLTYDHRIIDGAPAAQFLQRVKQIMQNPYLMI